MKTKVFILIAMLCFSVSAFAGWSVTNGEGGWMVVNGARGDASTTHIKVDNRKKGKRLAKQLNKIGGKAKHRARQDGN